MGGDVTMIDLSEFSTVASGRGNGDLTHKTYLYYHPSSSGKPGTSMYLKLGRKASSEVLSYFGPKCRVLVQPITGEIAVCRGDDKRFVAQNDKSTVSISCGLAREDFFRHHGEFKRMFFDVRWENDERGNKFLYCEPNGSFDRGEARWNS